MKSFSYNSKNVAKQPYIALCIILIKRDTTICKHNNVMACWITEQITVMNDPGFQNDC